MKYMAETVNIVTTTLIGLVQSVNKFASFINSENCNLAVPQTGKLQMNMISTI